jgi:L-gulonolactone oxidase
VSLRWANWAGDQICAPVSIEHPSSDAELIEAIRRAVQTGHRVRAVGAGHSFTDCACTDGVMIDTSRLNRILEVDRDRRTVTVQAGVRLYELGRPLAEAGLALENQGDIDRQSISGAVSTATHGTGAGLRNL